MNTIVNTNLIESTVTENANDFAGSDIAQLAELQLALVGGGCGDVLWG